jgi:hypothetical protein
MPASHTDRVYDEVRRRITEMASSAGVDRGRISLEVLYLLPARFIREYRWLHDQVLDDPVKPQMDGGKDGGRIKASGKPRDSMRARSMGPAKKGSKRAVNTYWPVKDEEFMRVKANLDRQLVRAVTRAVDEVNSIRAARRGEATVLHPATQQQCLKCGKFQRDEWVRCPHHLD